MVTQAAPGISCTAQHHFPFPFPFPSFLINPIICKQI